MIDKPIIYAVEDDDGIRELYEGAFENEYHIELFDCGESFFKRLAVKKPDLVILDIMLPGDDGYTILTRLREREHSLPILMVSAKSDEVSLVRGLNRGADDFIAKPFSVLELTARVKACLRRFYNDDLKFGNLSLNADRHTISYYDRELTLNRKEYELLKYLINNGGKTVTRDDLLSAVWDDREYETRTVDMHIKSLRQKLLNGSEQIITVRSVGYRLESKKQ